MSTQNEDIDNVQSGCGCSSEAIALEDSKNNGNGCCGGSATKSNPTNRTVTSELTSCDIYGTWKARWGVGRMAYTVEPGLYKLGNPSPESHVFVTANYKLTFDRVRSNLKGIDGWILVLDTKGINVWCAAGKGTFGTDELVKQIVGANLNTKVSHRQVIVPQLGAPGVSAHEVKAITGFKVKYGPVRSEDLLEFLKLDLKATPEMRKVNFTFIDRLVLVPVELTSSLKYLMMIVAGFIALSGLGKDGYSLSRMAQRGARSSANFTSGYLSGAALTPLLLPWLPGKAFAAKGAWAGLLTSITTGLLGWKNMSRPGARLGTSAWTLMIVGISSFMGMNFTGSSTYTSLSGVRKEMKVAVPLQIAFAGIGLILWLVSLFSEGDENA